MGQPGKGCDRPDLGLSGLLASWWSNLFLKSMVCLFHALSRAVLLSRWLVLQAILALAFLPVQRCLSQVPRLDTLRSYELAEIVVGEEVGEAAVPLISMQHVSLADIVREDAAALAAGLDAPRCRRPQGALPNDA